MNLLIVKKLSVKNDRNVITIISSHSLKLHSIHGYMYTMGKVYTHSNAYKAIYKLYSHYTYHSAIYRPIYICAYVQAHMHAYINTHMYTHTYVYTHANIQYITHTFMREYTHNYNRTTHTQRCSWNEPIFFIRP